MPPVKADIAIGPESLKKAETLLTAFQNSKEQKIAEFMARPTTKIESDVQLIMFDPMNIVCSNGRCLHMHGKLKIDGKERMMTTPFLVEYGDTIFDVKRVFITSDA